MLVPSHHDVLVQDKDSTSSYIPVIHRSVRECKAKGVGGGIEPIESGNAVSQTPQDAVFE